MLDSLPLLALLDVAMRGALIALLILLAVVMHRDHPRSAPARVGVAMCLCLCVQMVGSTPLFESLVPRLWQVPLVAVSVGNAVLFWLFVQALFDDEFSLRPLHAVAWVSVAALSGLNCAMVANSASVLAPVTMGLQRGVPLLFAGLAAMAAAKHWRSDLVEERRRLRAFIVVTGIAYTLASLVARLGSPQGRLLGLTATLDVVVLLVIVVVVASRMLHLSSSHLFPSTQQSAGATYPVYPIPASPPAATDPTAASASDSAPPQARAEALAPPDPVEDRLAQALQRLMVEQRAYRSDDLSLTSLAARLAVPEYRLRRLINQRLGYRNFNAFINGFRLDEVRAALTDPARRELPVLTIALDSGFQSIGPFNRAFKAATGLTPTEFRKENLANS
ncbi:AraC family transcriptional regulator [Rhodoferax sp. UBA5149]|uniref:AraC family transcriptional regulator n=1 Tax=Rhodoferax sp. UBA5149 TaxID=1947379 RepID=UPI0025F5E60C|nr:helix-turn-helix domain-containing protein [Rhodoferax sp. UBA5149]